MIKKVVGKIIWLYGQGRLDARTYDETGSIIQRAKMTISISTSSNQIRNFFKNSLEADPNVVDILIEHESPSLPASIVANVRAAGCNIKDLVNRPPVHSDEDGRLVKGGREDSAPGAPLPSQVGPKPTVEERLVPGKITTAQQKLLNSLNSANLKDTYDKLLAGEITVSQAKDALSIALNPEVKDPIKNNPNFPQPDLPGGKVPRVQQNDVINSESFKSYVSNLKQKMGFSAGMGDKEGEIPDLGQPSEPTPSAFFGIPTPSNTSLEVDLREQVKNTINVRNTEYRLEQMGDLVGTSKFTMPGVDYSKGETDSENLEENAPIRPSRPKRKQAVQQIGLSPAKRAILEKIQQQGGVSNIGVANTHMVEPIPGFVKAEVEVVYSNRYGASIVLGKDRAHPDSAHRATGYGGLGHTQCAAIDIVAGRMSPNPRDINKKGNKVEVDPLFNSVPSEFGQVMDAARIYVSQKTDVDDNFKLVDGSVGSSLARSAIAMKADAVRICATEGIKLVTSADVINSQGGAISQTLGVDIIAGNNDDNLQPMVLGDNLVDALFSMAAVVSALVGSHQSVLNDLVSLNAALSAHTHPSAFFGLPTLPGPMLQMYSIQNLIKLVSVDSFSAFAHKFNLNNYTFKYLWPGAPKTVRSYYNNVN
ncbi:MAG: hypothetical protein CBD26_03540 [Candidatus Pelagibacter sp. TMED166]|nr:MAG: hypothetical protein CBD26_03540 [Candidatus Pelagibacter sp. TMED166]|tara:strand:- start:1536 stop:3479 length:1944 start_codon:yes stop_codon:yes gene_type:complete